MTRFHVHGRLVHPNGAACEGATFKIFDLDTGGNGNDLLFTGVTDTRGEFDGDTTIDWEDVNSVGADVPDPVPGHGHWEQRSNAPLPGTHPVWVQDTVHVQQQVPDVQVLTYQIEYGGQTTPMLPYAPAVQLFPVPWPPPAVCLPRDEPLPGVRNLRILHRQHLYQWSRPSQVPGAAGVTFTPPLAQCEGVPVPEAAIVPDYLGREAQTLTDILLNDRLVASQVGPITNEAGFETLFPILPAPDVIGRWHDDQEFASQRLQGVNPVVLKKVSSLPADFPITDDHVRACSQVSQTPLAGALAAGRLYLADYEILAGIEAVHGAPGRHMPAPYALFYLRPIFDEPRPTTPPGMLTPVVPPPGLRSPLERLPGAELPGGIALRRTRLVESPLGATARDELVPIAIQIDRGFDRVRNPIFTPQDDRAAWEVAKMIVQMADLNAHELKSHLWDCHFAMEPFAVATARRLDMFHPISFLLNRHFPAMIYNNDLGRHQLINPGGPVDTLLGTGLAGSMEIMRRARLRWRFGSAGLASDLSQRGLADPATSIRDYPYRDDALLVHGAIRDFVIAYVALYYHSDADVAHDVELQGWLTELRSADVAGLPALSDRATLVDVVTQIIFTCSAQHAAVNYPQWEYMAFAPNMPAALWSDPRPDAAGVPRRDRFPLEPSKASASYQIDTVAKLARFHYDRLGQYGLPFPDVRAEQCAAQFRHRLVEIDQEIDRRNQGRRVRYEYLRPTNIPNSISV